MVVLRTSSGGAPIAHRPSGCTEATESPTWAFPIMPSRWTSMPSRWTSESAT